MGILIRVLINAAAIWVAAQLISGVHLSDATSTLLAALVLAIINAIVRPILIFLTLPVTLVTLGLFIFVLNAFCLWLTAQLIKGFEVQGLWAALFGSLIVSVVSWLLTAFVSDRGRVVVITRRDVR